MSRALVSETVLLVNPDAQQQPNPDAAGEP